ncbi:MAG: phosphotransferase [Sandaracinaceae bacterium]|nr:phosphotransferase [Sandaracinaceae bacterium]
MGGRRSRLLASAQLHPRAHVAPHRQSDDGGRGGLAGRAFSRRAGGLGLRLPARARGGTRHGRAHDAPARGARGGRRPSLAGPARALGDEILARWSSWDGVLDLPERVCHGDLKISNLRFDSTGRRAVCMLDLDTLSRLPYAVEMGDAWRSWCNLAGEDAPEATALDLGVFESSARAWLATAPSLEPIELESLVSGIERICLELAARFCGDAIRNAYFREDRSRFPSPGAHNLHRATGQLRLAVSARARRSACENIVRSAWTTRTVAGLSTPAGS